jgi:Leucine-rich repeat (LRR) protein
MLLSSPQNVINFYIKKRLEFIKENPLSKLKDSDITLLKLPSMKSIRIEKLKEFVSIIGNRTINSLTKNELELLLLPEMKEIRESIRQNIISSLSELQGTKIKITFPNSDIAKAVKLYPDYELFESIPVEVKSLTIEGDGSFAIDIPNNIDDFKNLEVLTLKNIIKSLPETIANCKELSFLSLSNNPSLTKLPEAILRMVGKVKYIGLENLPNLDKRSQQIKNMVGE